MRKQDLAEKSIIALALSLLVCMGVHNGHAMIAGLCSLFPTACATPPSFTAHAELGIADQPDNLPRKAEPSSSTRTRTPAAPTK